MGLKYLSLILATYSNYNYKDELNANRRTKEAISKVKATELGKNLPKESLPHLTTSRGFIVWSKAYQSLRQRLNDSQLDGWKERLKDLVRMSLEDEDDKKTTAYMIRACQFRGDF